MSKNDVWRPYHECPTASSKNYHLPIIDLPIPPKVVILSLPALSAVEGSKDLCRFRQFSSPLEGNRVGREAAGCAEAAKD
jgi:hypothetical protein